MDGLQNWEFNTGSGRDCGTEIEKFSNEQHECEGKHTTVFRDKDNGKITTTDFKMTDIKKANGEARN